MISTSRTPHASGTFYPSLPARLRADVRDYLERSEVRPQPAVGVLAPHAGYRYCGTTLGAAFSAVDVPGSCVVLGPSHTLAAIARLEASALLETAYRSPLGEVHPDTELGAALKDRAGALVVENASAHAHEHSIEVLLPFIQIRNPQARMVPLLFSWDDWQRTAELARAIHDVVKERDDVLVVASSDMNHYEAEDTTTDKDTVALDRIVALDGKGLLEITRERSITMCGTAAVACALEVARLAGKRKGEVVGYSNSSVADGNSQRVVGYAAAVLGVD